MFDVSQTYYDKATLPFIIKSFVMRITKEQLEQKKLQAQFDNSIGWLDTEKMNSQGIKTSQPMKLTGYVKPENAFFECKMPKPRW